MELRSLPPIAGDRVVLVETRAFWIRFFAVLAVMIAAYFTPSMPLPLRIVGVGLLGAFAVWALLSLAFRGPAGRLTLTREGIVVGRRIWRWEELSEFREIPPSSSPSVRWLVGPVAPRVAVRRIGHRLGRMELTCFGYPVDELIAYLNEWRARYG